MLKQRMVVPRNFCPSVCQTRGLWQGC